MARFDEGIGPAGAGVGGGGPAPGLSFLPGWGPLGVAGAGSNFGPAGASWNTIGQGVGRVADFFGLGDPKLQSTVADFTQANQTRDAQAAFLAQLQAAARGEGPSVAQGLLRQATDDQLAQAMALGAAQQGQGLGYGAALRQIADQRARIGQQSAAQAALLRAQEQQTAMGQLGNFTLGMRGQDIGQAGAGADDAFRWEALRQQGLQGAQANRRNLVGNIVNPIGGFLENLGLGGGSGGGGQWLRAPSNVSTNRYDIENRAHGGKVKKRTGYAHGGMDGTEGREHMDNEANDHVPAMLSPGEIVLPRSVTMAPDAEERAAAFVRAVKAGKGPERTQHPLMKMAEGGKVMSRKQEHFMQAVARGWKPSGRKGPSVAVAREFLAAKRKAA